MTHPLVMTESQPFPKTPSPAAHTVIAFIRWCGWPAPQESAKEQALLLTGTLSAFLSAS